MQRETADRHGQNISSFINEGKKYQNCWRCYPHISTATVRRMAAYHRHFLVIKRTMKDELQRNLNGDDGGGL